MTSPITDEQGRAFKETICHSVLLQKHRIGLSVSVATGSLSAVAVIVLLGYTVRNHIQLRRLELAGPTRRSSSFFRSHVDFYVLSLLFADLLQSLGAIVNIEWIRSSQCYCGSLCRTQGIIQTLGESGVAMSTFAISVHTFIVVFFSWHPPTGAKGVRIWGTVIGSIWLYLVLCISVGFSVNERRFSSKHGADIALADFFAPTPFWCWIGQGYMVERIAFEYVWLWTAALSSIFLYSILFLRLRGFISVDPKNWLRIRLHLRPTKSQELSNVAGPGGVRLQAMATSSGRLIIKQETSDALKLLYYPAAYTALVLPPSVVRWLTFDPKAPKNLSPTPAETPFTGTAVVLCIFGLSGLVNVVLFITTRPNVLGFGARRQARAEKLREQSAGAISTFGSIAVSGRNQNTGPRRMGDLRDGILVMQETTHSGSSMLSPSTSATHTKSGHTLRFDVVGSSEVDLTDAEDDAKGGGEKAEQGDAQRS
ncbi:hypothetical protein FRC10_010687 [Ceratobasidium sp. 414]|nr:hypothetical protein FRC10_010687 [Ceratobasidium sp. 414]